MSSGFTTWTYCPHAALWSAAFLEKPGFEWTTYPQPSLQPSSLLCWRNLWAGLNIFWLQPLLCLPTVTCVCPEIWIHLRNITEMQPQKLQFGLHLFIPWESKQVFLITITGIVFAKRFPLEGQGRTGMNSSWSVNSQFFQGKALYASPSTESIVTLL